MLNLPDLNVTGFESKAYIRYYPCGLSVAFCVYLRVSVTAIPSQCFSIQIHQTRPSVVVQVLSWLYFTSENQVTELQQLNKPSQPPFS